MLDNKHIKWNVSVYTHDIVPKVPSLKGFQKLISVLGESIKNISIKKNVEKSKYIVTKYIHIYILKSSVELH